MAAVFHVGFDERAGTNELQCSTGRAQGTRVPGFQYHILDCATALGGWLGNQAHVSWSPGCGL